MLLLITVFILLFLVQLILGIYAWYLRQAIPKKYSYPISELIEPAFTLEKYLKIYRKVNLRVNANIEEPALAQKEFLLLNREKMYEPDLYTNFYVIFQLELTKFQYSFIRRFFVFQNLVFFGQLVILVTTSILLNEILWGILIGFCLFSIALSIIGFITYDEILENSYTVALDLLNLDDVEQARADALRKDLRYRVFEYPFDILWKLVQFFKP